MFKGWFRRKPTTVATQADGVYCNGNTPLIELRNVTKIFETAAGPFTALDNITLSVDRGEFVAIIGKSGSGKSTLMNMISGIDRPTSGEVFVGDTAVHTLNESEMAVWRGRNVGIVFQFFQLLPALSLVENVMLPMDFCNTFTPRERRERAMMLLDQVGLADQAHKLPAAISGGQQQRVAIARALANDPPIILADEPTGNLNSKTAQQVFALFERLVDQGKTILMVTHDSDMARRVSRAVIIADGRIVNEYVARALATLTLDQLGWVMRHAESRTYAPGAIIREEGEPVDNFYIITKGEVEVFIEHPDGGEIVVNHLSSGAYFGEIGLLREGRRTASVRASFATGCEVAVLDRQEFQTLLAESEATRQAIDRVASERDAQTRAAEASAAQVSSYASQRE
ncbi:MAG: ATP-binding cassette domain-containing protein [Roseiflexaceae bacterium]|nr:ATP-binding cassette domain-containing protein [Roseiflexaceae bacterium]